MYNKVIIFFQFFHTLSDIKRIKLLALSFIKSFYSSLSYFFLRKFKNAAIIYIFCWKIDDDAKSTCWWYLKIIQSKNKFIFDIMWLSSESILVTGTIIILLLINAITIRLWKTSESMKIAYRLQVHIPVIIFQKKILCSLYISITILKINNI